MDPMHFNHGDVKVTVYECTETDALTTGKVVKYKSYAIAWRKGKAPRARKAIRDKKTAIKFAKDKLAELASMEFVTVNKQLLKRLGKTSVDEAIVYFLAHHKPHNGHTRHTPHVAPRRLTRPVKRPLAKQIK